MKLRFLWAALAVGLVLGLGSFSVVVGEAPLPAPVQDEAATISLEGTLAPRKTSAVSVSPKRYDGEIRLKSLLAAGSRVEAGGIVAEVEYVDGEERLQEARSRATVADESLEMNRRRVKSFEESVGRRKKALEQDLENARKNLAWFKEAGRADRLKSSELNVQANVDSVADQEDELAQLDKLYKGNDLAKDSQEIVLKRARRRLEQSRERLKMAQNADKRLREHDIIVEEQGLMRAVERLEFDLRHLDNTTGADLLEVQILWRRSEDGARAARRALTELEADLASTMIKAAMTGLLQHGSWGEAGLSSLKPGDKLGRGTIATVIDDKLMQVSLQVPVAKAQSLPVGGTVVVGSPRMGVSTSGRVAARSPVVRDENIAVVIEVDDPKGLMPGQKVTVSYSPK
jgi:hypothetical protein